MLSWLEEKQIITGEVPEEYTEAVDVKMIMYNHIEGILSLKLQYIDNVGIFYYPTPEMISLERMLKDRGSGAKQYISIYEELCHICRRGEPYFLKPEHYVLDPTLMMWDIRKDKLQLCYFPPHAISLGNQMKALTECFLKWADHKDKALTGFLYDIYEVIVAEGFFIPVIERLLEDYKSRLNQRERKQVVDLGQDDAGGKGRHSVRKSVSTNGFRLEGVDRKHKSGSSEAFESFQLTGESCSVGRSPDNQIVLPFWQVSRYHAELKTEGRQIFLTDRGSANGTFLNGKQITSEHPVLCRAGDLITFADLTYRLKRTDSCP